MLLLAALSALLVIGVLMEADKLGTAVIHTEIQASQYLFSSINHKCQCLTCFYFEVR